MHIVLLMVRLLTTVCGMTHWQDSLRRIKSGEIAADRYNLAFYEAFSKQYFQYVMCAFIMIGVVLDILCYKYRKLASFLFFYECLHLCMASLVFVDHGVHGAFVTFVTLLAYVLCLGCYQGIALITALAVYFMIQFVVLAEVQADEAKLGYLAYHKVLYMLCLFFLGTFGSITLNWVLKLVVNFERSKQTSMTLIRQMTEGCFIYDLENENITYCNGEAQSIMEHLAKREDLIDAVQHNQDADSQQQ